MPPKKWLPPRVHLEDFAHERNFTLRMQAIGREELLAFSVGVYERAQSAGFFNYLNLPCDLDLGPRSHL